MNLTTLSDRQLMQHWNVAAQICAATTDQEILNHYSRQLKYLNHEMDRRDTERRPVVDKRAKFPTLGKMKPFSRRSKGLKRPKGT